MKLINEAGWGRTRARRKADLANARDGVMTTLADDRLDDIIGFVFVALTREGDDVKATNVCQVFRGPDALALLAGQAQETLARIAQSMSQAARAKEEAVMGGRRGPTKH